MPSKKNTSVPPTLTEADSLTIAEFSALFGFPPEAILEAIQRNRTAIKKAYYSIPDLAVRWGVSRQTVYNILADSEFEILNLTRSRDDKQGKRSKGKRLVSAAVVEKIEKIRTERAA